MYSYTVHVDNSVAQVTIAGTPDGDGTVDYEYTDADPSGTDGHQVNLPTLGSKIINVVVRPYGQRAIAVTTVATTDDTDLHRAGDP